MLEIYLARQNKPIGRIKLKLVVVAKPMKLGALSNCPHAGQRSVAEKRFSSRLLARKRPGSSMKSSPSGDAKTDLLNRSPSRLQERLL
jgi:hypothetical protein